MNKLPYILIEGTTCSGKTTHANKLIASLEEKDISCSYWKSVTSNGLYGKSIKKLLKNCPFISTKLRETFYVSDLFLDEKAIAHSKKQNSKGIIRDRGPCSYISFSEIFLDNNTLFGIKRFYDQLVHPNIVIPDMVLFLHCTSDTLENRITEKTKSEVNAFDKMLLKNKELFKARTDNLERHLLKTYPINKIYKIQTDGELEATSNYIFSLVSSILSE